MIDRKIKRCGHRDDCVAICPTDLIELIESRLTIGDTCTWCATSITVCLVGDLTAEKES